MKPHYGLIISRTIRLKGHTIHSVAKHLNIDKVLLQEWLTKDSISLILINNIGAVIVHDFSKDFPEIFNPIKSEIVDNITAMQTPVYMDKYIQLLEKYNARLVEVINKCRREHGDSCCR